MKNRFIRIRLNEAKSQIFYQEDLDHTVIERIQIIFLTDINLYLQSDYR